MSLTPKLSMTQPLAHIAMKCPGCGAGLQIAQEMEHFACGYCGTSIRTVRQGGTVSLLVDAVAKVQIATDRTAAELGLARLGKELDKLDKELEELNALHAPVPLPKPSLWDVLNTEAIRAFDKKYREDYPRWCQEWEITQEKIRRLQACREELIAKISSLRRIVD